MAKKGVLQTLKQGGREQRRVRLRYTRLDGKTVTRTVDPYEIRAGNVFAVCRTHGRIHEFRLAGIQKATLLKTGYRPKWPVQL